MMPAISISFIVLLILIFGLVSISSIIKHTKFIKKINNNKINLKQK